MGNRKRLDPGVREEIDGYLADVLQAQGHVIGEQVQRVAELTGRSVRTVGRYVEQVADKLGIDLVERGAPKPEVSGIDAMLDGQPFTFADEQVKCAALAYFGNLAALHRDACSAAQQLGLAGPLSHTQMTRKFNAELPQKQRELIRRGIEGFRASSLYIRWSAEERNEVWQIDATELDLWIMPKGTNKRIRPWALFLVDDHSRVILSASLLLHDYTAADAAACVHRALRIREVTLPDGRTVTLGGLPGKILCDNALQFTGELLSHVAQTLGFMVWAVAAYAGEKKGKVERVVRVANEGFARRLPGYANRNHKTLTMKDTLHAADVTLLDEQQVLDEFGKWVEEYNNSPHPTIVGKSRYEVWADSDGVLEAVDEELLLPATVAMPLSGYAFSKDGFRIQRDGVKYFYPDLTETLEVGTRYKLRHLPGDADWVDAYSMDGEFLVRCWHNDAIPHSDRVELEKRRREAYLEIASLRSKAVALRSQAVARAQDDPERPNVLATARQHELAPGTNDLVRASLRPPGSDSTPQLTEAATDTVTQAAAADVSSATATEPNRAADDGSDDPPDGIERFAAQAVAATLSEDEQVAV